MSTMSTPESTATSNVQGLEICLPAIDVEDSHFQLPIRRHPRIASNIVKDTVINQGYAPGDMNNDSIDKSDSDASQVILTPEAGLSEEELELHSTKEIVTGNDRPMDPENLKEFYDAVARGDVELVKNYIDLGVSVSLKTTEGYTPLVIAILGAQLETARFLLEHGASVHQRANGVPPIVYVSMTAAPAPRFLKLLLDYGASPNTVHGPQHYNALHWAAHVGNIDAVDFLVSTGTDIEQTCSQGRTPLLIAATNGNTGVAKVLLAKGAEINHRSLNGATALGWAACHGHVDIARYLLGEGLNVDNRDNSGISPLWGASSLGSIEVVELLIEKGAVIDVISREQNHYTPVMAAAFAGHADVVQVLVDHGADLTVQNSDGSAVLETAIAGGNADTVGLLLEVLGGDDDLQETIAIDIAIAKSIAEIKSGMTKADLLQPATNMETLTQQSMYRAIIGKILKEGGELLKQHALSNMMSIALQDKDLDMVIALLANGANPNQYLAHGQTPLHIAIIQQNAKLVKIMLEWGADPTVSTRKTEGSNYTPLHQALITLDSDQDKDTSIVDLLLKTGQCKLMTGEDARSTAFDYVLSHYSTWDHGVAEIMTFRMVQCTEDIQNDRSDDGSTLMHAAIWHGRADLASILITRSVDINVTDNQGCTPFVLECQRSTRLLRFLLSNGADPYVKDINDQTALHAAASQGKIGVINFLFHLGLPVNTPDKNDYTPFSWAIICGQEDAALHLLNLGAKISHKPFRRGRTLMHTASSLSMSRVVEKLIEIPSLKLLVDHKDGMGWTPLALSCRKAGEDVVSALIDAGADIEVSPNDTLDRPLHLALRAGNSSVAKCLISRGAHVIARGEHGQTALHLAADADIMQILLNRGVETNALDDAGRTPLCGCTDAGLAQLLVGRGAHVNHKSGHDWTSLHRAVASGDVEMFTILMKAGGDVGARTTDDGLDVLERIEEVEDQAMRVEFEKAVLEWKMR